MALKNVTSALQRSDAETAAKTSKARKAAAKRPETVEEAFERIRTLKLTDAERGIVNDVERLVRTGELTLPDGKLSKKTVFALNAEYREIVRDRKRAYVIETRPANNWIVQDAETLERVGRMLRDETLTSFDTETTGLDVYNDRVVGYSFYMPKNDVDVYIPFAHTTGQRQVSEQAALDVARRYLTNPTNQTVWHNYKYDGHMFLNHGISVANPFWDTQVAAKLLNENEASFKLKVLHAKYVLGREDEAITFEDLFDDHVIYDKDVILSGVYAGGDARKTFKLYDFQKPFIDARDRLRIVWYEIEQALLSVDLAMERTGFRIDLAYVERLRTEFEPRLLEAERQLREAFGIDQSFIAQMSAVLGRTETEFNVNSPQHLAYLIYDHLGVDPTFGMRFKKPLRSTAADVVDALCDDHEALSPLLRYRTLSKLLSTYIRKIPQAMEPATGRLHVRFNNMSNEDDSSTGAATGRYSSSEYVSGKNSRTGDVAKGLNIQNIPSKGEGKEVRKCFIPDDGWVFIGSDLSKIEPVIISHILATKYGDVSMRDMFRAGVDLYTDSAVKTFGFDREYCVDGAYDPTGTFQPRKLAKQGVLSYLYGSSAKSFARSMGVSETVASEFFDGMLAAFPGLQAFRDDVMRQLLTNGTVAHVETLFGRKRRFPEYRRDKAELERLNALPWKKRTDDVKERRSELWKRCARVERQALNCIIQGTAADVLKMNVIALHRLCVKNGWKFHASIHDEIWISIPIVDLTPETVQAVNDAMTKTVTLSVPLKTDLVIQPRWMDEYRAEDWDFENMRPKDAGEAA